MAVVAVNKNGSEVMADSLVRCRLDKHFRIESSSDYSFLNKDNTDFWACIYDNPDEGYENIAIELPKGSIKKLIGRELTWEDNPVELI
ncbi:fructan hydrolase [Bacteroides heparinolyticus]|uniref:fructan hydrolase n=1 Tax=Prevotella heparinolytica TaxID=28113 RepID=UPI0035A15ED4